MASVLIIDDDPGFGHVLAEVAKSQGHTPSWAITLAQGLEMAARVKPEVVFLDVLLPDGNGLEAVGPLKDTLSRPEVIVVTGLVDAEGAESAIRGGAWDYVEKSSSPPQLALSLKRALRFRKAERAGLGMLRRQHIAGDGPRMTQALALAARAASGDLSVLFAGASMRAASARRLPLWSSIAPASPRTLWRACSLGMSKEPSPVRTRRVRVW